jgi:hypothetical protein
MIVYHSIAKLDLKSKPQAGNHQRRTLDACLVDTCFILVVVFIMVITWSPFLLETLARIVVGHRRSRLLEDIIIERCRQWIVTGTNRRRRSILVQGTSSNTLSMTMLILLVPVQENTAAMMIAAIERIIGVQRMHGVG